MSSKDDIFEKLERLAEVLTGSGPERLSYPMVAEAQQLVDELENILRDHPEEFSTEARRRTSLNS